MNDEGRQADLKIGLEFECVAHGSIQYPDGTVRTFEMKSSKPLIYEVENDGSNPERSRTNSG